ncbi:MAG: hypothetical protein D6707_09905, partial [Bacteroidetes bacterium]
FIIPTCLFSFLSIFPGFRFYGHYWLQLLPALALLTGTSIFIIHELLEKKLKKNAKWITVAIVITTFTVSFTKEKKYLLSPNYTQVLRRVYGMNPFPETWQVAQYIKQKTSPEDEIVALGSEPEIYFYTNRRCASRIAYTSKAVNGSERHKEWQKELIHDIETKMPKYIVFYNHPTSWMVQPGADQTIFKWFNKFASQNYKLVGIADMQNPYNTRYVWEQKVLQYKPKGQFYILVYERKSDNNKQQ